MNILAIGHDHPGVSSLEAHCRAILSERLQRFAVAESFEAAHANGAMGRFDVVLLDPPPYAEALPAAAPFAPADPPRTIVVSARTSLALRAYEYGAIDFVPKPVTRERLARALMRVAPSVAQPPPGEFIGVRRFGCIELLPMDELVRAEAADKYTTLVTARGKRLFHDKSLGQLERMLPPAFVRIHKSYVVRFSLIARLRVLRGTRLFAVLKTGEQLPVGRTRYAQLRRLFL